MRSTNFTIISKSTLWEIRAFLFEVKSGCRLGKSKTVFKSYLSINQYLDLF